MYDFTIQTLGEPTVASPISFSTQFGDSIANYVREDSSIVYHVDLSEERFDSVEQLGLLERAGPRQNIYFNPKYVHAGIVTCGGLCPGLNDVIKGLVMTLWNRYGVRTINGIRYGYHGLLSDSSEPILPLNPDVVREIHRVGGTILGTSRGKGERTAEMIDTLLALNINILFVIGGDGTQRAAIALVDEINARGLKIGVVGVPKTIDNDLSFVQRSFGFETAVAKATDAVLSAHSEASSIKNGVGLVQVMGRESGFIAAHTALASQSADLVLVPEVQFDMHGANGVLQYLDTVLTDRGNAVIVVAEGAGQRHLVGSGDDGMSSDSGKSVVSDKSGTVGTNEQPNTDASGNKKLLDIGRFLEHAIKTYCSGKKSAGNIKYINPSYIIRSSVATPADSLYCTRLATNAVHAAMAGKTGMLISLINNHFVHVPIKRVVEQRNQIDPEGSLWRDVLEATGQPLQMHRTSPDESPALSDPTTAPSRTSGGSNS